MALDQGLFCTLVFRAEGVLLGTGRVSPGRKSDNGGVHQWRLKDIRQSGCRIIKSLIQAVGIRAGAWSGPLTVHDVDEEFGSQNGLWINRRLRKHDGCRI